jgi:precorrin-4 methylase
LNASPVFICKRLKEGTELNKTVSLVLETLLKLINSLSSKSPVARVEIGCFSILDGVGGQISALRKQS